MWWIPVNHGHMHGGVLIDLEESLSVVIDCGGPQQVWSCSKQSTCYGNSPWFVTSQDNLSTVITPSGIFVELSCKQSWCFLGDLDWLQQWFHMTVPDCSTIYHAYNMNLYDNHRFRNSLFTDWSQQLPGLSWEYRTTYKCLGIDDTVSMIHNRMDVFNTPSVTVERP